jgi:hypothetical protein
MKYRGYIIKTIQGTSRKEIVILTLDGSVAAHALDIETAKETIQGMNSFKKIFNNTDWKLD